MKIGEARQRYAAKSEEYWEQKRHMAKQKKELELRSNTVSKGKEQYLQEAAALELSYQAVSEKYEEYHSFMERLMNIRTGIYNGEVSKQQGDVMMEAARETAKVMEVARRISKGGTVPAADERKLMEYSMVMYTSAKNMAMLNEQKEQKKYGSLWKEEEEITEPSDPNELANNSELEIEAPELVEIAQVMVSAPISEGGASPI